MERPRGMDIVRLAYELWQRAGEPDGRDWEFYLQAETELRGRVLADTEEVHPGR